MATKRHQWLKDHDTNIAFLVLRIDNYDTMPQSRGQFYPMGTVSEADKPGGKAIWPTQESAEAAAHWATNKFGHTYAVFKMIAIVEPVLHKGKVTRVSA